MPAKTKTEIKECTSLQIHEYHTLALLAIFLTQDPTEQGGKGSYITASCSLYTEAECDSMSFSIFRYLTGMETARNSAAS